jgi:hypothetical protein
MTMPRVGVAVLQRMRKERVAGRSRRRNMSRGSAQMGDAAGRGRGELNLGGLRTPELIRLGMSLPENNEEARKRR